MNENKNENYTPSYSKVCTSYSTMELFTKMLVINI